MTALLANAALIVIDVQEGFVDPIWGPTTNHPGCENNVSRLVGAWAHRAGPLVVVRHDSLEPSSPLALGTPGNAFMPLVTTAAADLEVSKSVNSAFYGSPDLHEWLTQRQVTQLVLCGIQTNMCVETTARMAGNLGYDVRVALDATRTFDLTGPTLANDVPWTMSADELMRATAVNLHGGGFAEITQTDAVLRS